MTDYRWTRKSIPEAKTSITRAKLIARKKKLARSFMNMSLLDAYNAIEEIKKIDTKLERMRNARL